MAASPVVAARADPRLRETADPPLLFPLNAGYGSSATGDKTCRV